MTLSIRVLRAYWPCAALAAALLSATSGVSAQTTPAPSSRTRTVPVPPMHGAHHATHAEMAMPAASTASTRPASGTHHENMSATRQHPARMAGMNVGSMQGGRAPPEARSADYSDGVDGSRMPHMHGKRAVAMLLIDQLEAVDSRDGNGHAFELSGWFGGDENKLWLRSEGEIRRGKVEEGDVEVLWNHAIAAYWDSQSGLRHDLGQGPSRNWLAFGVQGLAPYWFRLEATGYLGESGRTSARLRASNEMLFTQRWILEPELELNLYGENDPARRVGRGLSDISLGLRLRYEVRREFAPYIGINWVRRVGTSADYARSDGRQAFDQQLVAGIRLWF